MFHLDFSVGAQPLEGGSLPEDTVTRGLGVDYRWLVVLGLSSAYPGTGFDGNEC